MTAAPDRKRHGTRMATARELFNLGWDTAQIADYWHISEPEALRRLTIERCNAKCLPSPYEVAA
jgi:hypothetical protein